MTEVVKDLPVALASFIESRRAAKFEWGVNDCALFAADWVLTVTGVDHAEGLRGKYDDEAGARRLIEQAGGMAAFAAELSPTPLGFAQRGDVVLAVIDGHETFGVCLGNGQWCAPGLRGLVFRPMTDVIQCFRF